MITLVVQESSTAGQLLVNVQLDGRKVVRYSITYNV